MKTPKSKLKQIAFMHAAGVLLATESLIAFQDSGLTNEEMHYIDSIMHKIAVGLLNKNEPIYDANAIVKYVKSLPIK